MTNNSTENILHKPLAFAGVKHSGKSTFGKKVAHALHVQFADSDELLLIQYNERNPSPFSNLRDLYREKGKEVFMEYEYLGILHYFENISLPGILSLGGGIVDNVKAMNIIKEKSFILYLDVPEEILYKRIISKGIPPFLDSMHPKDHFSKIYNDRSERYMRDADIILNVGGLPIDESLSLIMQKILEEHNVWK